MSSLIAPIIMLLFACLISFLILKCFALWEYFQQWFYIDRHNRSHWPPEPYEPLEPIERPDSYEKDSKTGKFSDENFGRIYKNFHKNSKK